MIAAFLPSGQRRPTRNTPTWWGRNSLVRLQLVCWVLYLAAHAWHARNETSPE